MRNKYLLPIIIVSLLVNLLLVWQVWAGSPNSPGEPGATSSYSLEDLYQRLNAGIVGSSRVFTEPTIAPGVETMHSINEIMAKAPALDNTHGATTTQVLAGQTFWGLTGGQWGLRTGAMPNNGAGSAIVPTTTNQSVAAGYWSSVNTVQGDADLTAGNIRRGMTIFGVTGSLAPGAVAKRVAKTGQTQCWDNSDNLTSCAGTGQDGAYQMGIEPAIAPTSVITGAYNTPAWTGVRFTDNGDGTVTDNLTALVWLKNADCWGGQIWANALSNSNGLASGSCGLSDGSSAGEWRLPNINELHSLIDLTQSSPALPGEYPFTGVQLNYYWSSTSQNLNATFAWLVHLGDGRVRGDHKSVNHFYVWPVRGGQ